MSATPVANAGTKSDELPKTPGPSGKDSLVPVDSGASASESQDSPQGTQVKITLSAEDAASLDELCAKEGITTKAQMFRTLLRRAVDSASRHEKAITALGHNLASDLGDDEDLALQGEANMQLPSETVDSVIATAKQMAATQLAAQLLQGAQASIADPDSESES